ncbi:adhesion G protein-coupled receptor L3-like isoform X2 [Actinia tenebrosa]|uniref:Adhesion G protein-coupled receptor L3-like isoform X2 n=1 Tax=Actinia tenebrosa TaxID=6105 RepID=A0A6P8J4H4_ACTTE|nr:adhesion G protein-coupled receptor L3-like isoform X2 [Actinia tenebrosa]
MTTTTMTKTEATRAKTTAAATAKTTATAATTTTTEPIPTTMFVPTTRPFDKASTGFTELNERNITKDNAQKVVQELVNLTQTTEMNGGDTLAAVDIINKLATGNVLSPKNRNETEQAGQAIVETASRLLGSENEESWKYIKTKNTTNQKTSSHNVLEAIEKIAVDLGSGLEKDENVTIETDHVAMGIIKKNMANFTGDSYPHYDQLSEKWQLGDRLYIPPETADAFKTREGSETTVFFVLYNRINNALKSNLKEGTVINSRVLSVGFDRDLINPLPKPVVISFTKYQMDNLTSPVCSFLDFSNKTSGDWSNHGVKMTSFEGNKIECESNHLTNFAVLMQVKKFKISKPHTQALQMITYIGCGISLFGLALTLATFLSLETLASERTSIHKNLVVAIGLAQIIFLAGIDVVYNPIACKIVALCLHYLYTAAFTWMCCEGLHLYTKVIEVFSSEASKMKYYYMLGWGVPLIIVIISAASRIDGYSTEYACWISIDHGLIWAFVGPVLVIMCINFVVMVMVIKVILASVTSIQNPGNTSQVKAGLKGMVVLLPLLGLTWVFGLMAVNEKTIAFQYIFAILNSLQGLFIFAFHCIGNSEVRVAYKRLHEKRTLAKSLPEHSLSSGNHHKNVEEFNKRRMNSRETNSTGDEDIIVTKAIRSVSDVKLTGGTDHVAMQTFGDADSGRWSLNCPSPDPPCIVFQSATKDPRGNPRSAPDILNGPKATPRESYRSDGNYPTDRHRYRGGNQDNRREESSSTNKYQRF